MAAKQEFLEEWMRTEALEEGRRRKPLHPSARRRPSGERAGPGRHRHPPRRSRKSQWSWPHAALVPFADMDYCVSSRPHMTWTLAQERTHDPDPARLRDRLCQRAHHVLGLDAADRPLRPARHCARLAVLGSALRRAARPTTSFDAPCGLERLELAQVRALPFRALVRRQVLARERASQAERRRPRAQGVSQ